MAEFHAKQGVLAPYIHVHNNIGPDGGKIVFSGNSEETITMAKIADTVSFDVPATPSNVVKLPLTTTGLINARAIHYNKGSVVVAGTNYLGYGADLRSLTRINTSPFNQSSFSPNVVSNPTSTLWVIGATNAVYTSDNGTSWATKTVPTNKQYYGCVFFRGRLWISCNGGVIRSDDYGNTWVYVEISNGLEFKSIYADENRILVGGVNGSIYSSNDGQTWNKLNFPLPYFDITSIKFHKGMFHFQTSEGEIYTSTDLVNFSSIRSFSTRFSMLLSTDDYLLVAGGEPSRVSVSPGNSHWDYIELTEMQSRSAYVNGATVVDNNHILILSSYGEVFQVTIGAEAKTLLAFNASGATISAPQLDKENALVRKDYVDRLLDGIVAGQPEAILAETDKRYLKLTGGTVTGETTFKDKVVMDSATPSIVYKVNGDTKYQLGINGSDFTFDTDAPPSTYTARATIPGTAGVIYNACYHKGVYYAVGVRILAKSTDAGITWTAFTLPGMVANTDWLECESIDDHIIIFGKDNSTGTAYRYSSPDGIVWTRMPNPVGSRVYDNPTSIFKLKNGKYIQTGLGFVAVSDTLLGAYKRFEFHSNTPAVTKYCHTISDFGDRIVAHVADPAGANGKAYLSTDGGASWVLTSYTGATPQLFVMGAGMIGNTSYLVDAYCGLYSTDDGIALTQLIAPNSNTVMRFGAFDLTSEGNIVCGDSTGNVRYTSDKTTWSALKTPVADLRMLLRIPDAPYTYMTFSNLSQVGTAVIQYAGSAFVITQDGPVTNRKQLDMPNALVRKDYVDTVTSAVETKMESRNYLPLVGGTLSGQLVSTVASTTLDKYALQLTNGSIGGTNKIAFTKSTSDDKHGLLFLKSAALDNSTIVSDYDVLTVMDGSLLLNGLSAYGAWNKPTLADIGLNLDYMFYTRTSSGDLDKDVLPGHYYITNSATNRPVTTLLFGHMTVSSTGSTGQGHWFQQTFYGHAAPFKIWTRRNVNGTFSPWKRIYTEDDPITAAELGINADGLNPDLYYTKNQVYSQDQVNTKFTQFNEKYDSNNDGVVDKATVATMVAGAAETGYPSFYGKNVDGVVGFHAFTPRTVDDTLNQQYIVDMAKANVPVRINLESPAPLQNLIIQCFKAMTGIQNITDTLVTFNSSSSPLYYIENDNLAFTETGAAIKVSHMFNTTNGPTTGTYISEEISASEFQKITGIV